MAVAYDNSTDTEDFGVTSLTTPSFTISGSNRAAILGLHTLANVTNVTGTCGGVSATLTPNTNRLAFTVYEVQLLEVVAPATGSQTASASWTTAASASLTAITFTSVHQTTPTRNGATNEATFTTTINQVVTSASGNMTTTLCATGSSDELQTTNQTLRQSAFACMDTGPGTGSTTHTWTPSSAMDLLTAGVDVVDVAFVEPPIVFVTSGGATIGTAASTWSLATPSSKVGGGAFIVGIGPASSAVTVSTVTDNTTNVYLKAVARASTAAARAELWYCNQISSASTRISVTLSANASGSMGVAHFTGLSTGSPHDSTASTGSFATGLSTVHTAGQVTPGASNALVIMFSRSVNSTISPAAFDGGMTAWISTGTAVRTHGSYIIQGASASTCTGQWRTNAATSTGGTLHAAVIATFLDTRASAGGVVLVPEYHFMLLGLN